MNHLRLATISLLSIACQISLIAQQERIVNWDFEVGLEGVNTFLPSAAWNSYSFEKTKWAIDASASNGLVLQCQKNKPFVGKDNLGIGQYSGRAQSIMPCPEPGVQYTFSARARMKKSLNGNDPGEVVLIFYDSNQNEIDSKILTFTEKIFEQKSITFLVPSNTVWATVWVRNKGEIYFNTDWVSLKAHVDDTPVAVSSFTASEIGTTRIKLNWSEIPNASGYRIERKKSSDGYPQWKPIFITHDPGNITSFLDTRDSGLKALEPGQTYNYRIFALGDYGNSPEKTLDVTTATLTNSPGNTTYYINSNIGDDSNVGTSKEEPWKSFLNLDNLQLNEGDKVLLRAGNTWTEPLHIHGSGSANKIININRYGIGDDPKIILDGKSHAAIQLLDVSNCRIRNLELSNFHPFFREMKKFGIRAGTWENTTISNLEFNNIFINKIRGSAVRGGNLGSISGGELCAGIRVATDIRGRNNDGKSINDITIINNNLSEIENHAIHLIDVSSLTVSGNIIYRPGYISLLVNNINNGIIKNNYFIETGYTMSMADNAALDIYMSSNTTIEDNVIYKVYNDKSGQSINLDSCQFFKVQYNFFKESASGCFVSNRSSDNIFRYNVSEGFNDDWFRNLGSSNTQIYNNTIYAYDSNHSATGYFINNTESVISGTPALNTSVWNNIFIREIGSEAETADLIYESETSSGSVFSNNVFFGNFTDQAEEDSNPFFDDPELVDPGSGLVNIINYTFDNTGYQLQNTSPYIQSGLVISNNGGYDFWDNSVSPTEAPSIGAYQSAAVLPIELMDFYAFKKNEQVELEWQTAWEQNNLGFEVQHSKDGKSWDVISFEEGKGNSDQLNHYQYTHRSPNVGDNYYRLKQIDFDDHGTDDGNYSSMEYVYFEDESSLGIDVFPNPSSGFIHIRNSNNGLFNWILLDSSGREIIQQKQLTKEQQIDLSMLPKGLYVLHMETDTQSSNIKITLVD